MVRAEIFGPGPVIGDRAVEGETDRIQHRRLAGAGRALEEEQTGVREGVEVHDLVAGERQEGGELKAVEAHQAAASACRRAASASVSSARSASLAGVPRRSSTNRSTSSMSLAPFVRLA